MSTKGGSLPYDATKRALVETPKAQKPTRPTHAATGIGKYRAIAMASQLERVGVPQAQQLSFAAGKISRLVRDLSDLTTEEAKVVWRAAASRGVAGGLQRTGRRAA